MPVKSRLPLGSRSSFTLIELLAVIAVMGVLVAFALPAVRGIQRSAKISTAKSEMQQIETALESYRAQYGFYPPGNGAGSSSALFNQLYYELSGVTNVTANSKPCYQTFFGGSIVGTAFYANMFNVGGIVNCSKAGGGEDTVPAKNFLYTLRPNQIGSLPITNGYGGYIVNFLVTSVGGPDANYQPMGFSGLNPFRYVAPSPTNNNANGYDLWIQLVFGGKTNLLCNWSTVVSFNRPLP